MWRVYIPSTCRETLLFLGLLFLRHAPFLGLPPFLGALLLKDGWSSHGVPASNLGLSALGAEASYWAGQCPDSALRGCRRVGLNQCHGNLEEPG